MKNNILLPIIICIANILCAQNNYVSNANILINTPQVPLVSTVTIDYTHVYENKLHEVYTFEYEWTQNNTNVTFEDQWNKYYAEMNANGDVVYYEGKSKTYPYPYSCKDSYEYDSLHRVIKKESNENSRTLAYYTNTNNDSIVSGSYNDFVGKWIKITKEEIKRTDSYFDRIYYTFNNDTQSYVYRFTNRNYIDSKGRVVKSMDIDSSSGCVYEYSYIENGYTELITYYGSSHASFKKDYIFNGQGYISSYYYYEWFNGSYWKPCIMSEYTYDYITVSIEKNEKGKLFSIQGYNILFEVDADTEVSIYTLKGINIFHGKVSCGSVISLPSHEQLYVLKIGNKVFKIII